MVASSLQKRERWPFGITGLALLSLCLGAGGKVAPYPNLGHLRWVGLGGGPTPASNQVSIEADLGLAREVLGAPRALLYAGGAGTRSVQVYDARMQGDPLVARLGDLFAPHGGRHARYRPTRLAVTGPARLDTLEGVLGEALAAGDLTLYVAAHGQQGDTPQDAQVALWSGWSLRVLDVRAMAEKAPRGRTLRLVLTSCYSGGFADVLFDGEGEGPSHLARGARRCGLFATTWDRPAAGCDPSPDRRAHQGYGIHFLHALRGEDRDGRPLPASAIDFDGDGRVSLLEAHARVRIASRTLDVPTTTSERWLRAVAPARGPSAPVDLPEERAVIRALSARLHLDEAGARRRLAEQRRRLEAARRALDRAERATDEAWWDLSGLLLSRYPVLDDPYHPLWRKTLQEEGRAITALLDTHPLARTYEDRRRAEDTLAGRVDDLLLESAPVERLVRAYETLRLAGRLAARGGRAWQIFQDLRACERGL